MLAMYHPQKPAVSTPSAVKLEHLVAGAAVGVFVEDADSVVAAGAVAVFSASLEVVVAPSVVEHCRSSQFPGALPQWEGEGSLQADFGQGAGDCVVGVVEDGADADADAVAGAVVVVSGNNCLPLQHHSGPGGVGGEDGALDGEHAAVGGENVFAGGLELCSGKGGAGGAAAAVDDADFDCDAPVYGAVREEGGVWVPGAGVGAAPRGWHDVVAVSEQPLQKVATGCQIYLASA